MVHIDRDGSVQIPPMATSTLPAPSNSTETLNIGNAGNFYGMGLHELRFYDVYQSQSDVVSEYNTLKVGPYAQRRCMGLSLTKWSVPT